MASQESRDNYAADEAARAQLQATREALQFLRDQWAQQREDQRPWMQMGGGAANRLGYLMGLEGYAPANLTGAFPVPDGWTKGGSGGGAGGGTGGSGGGMPPPGGGMPPPPDGG